MHSAPKDDILYDQKIVRYEIKIIGMIYIFCMFACDKTRLSLVMYFMRFYCKCISCFCNKDCASKCSNLKASMVTIHHKRYTYFTQFYDELSNNRQYHNVKPCISLLIHSNVSYNSPAVPFDEYSL